MRSLVSTGRPEKLAIGGMLIRKKIKFGLAELSRQSAGF
jgi:hypothetical protein